MNKMLIGISMVVLGISFIYISANMAAGAKHHKEKSFSRALLFFFATAATALLAFVTVFFGCDIVLFNISKKFHMQMHILLHMALVLLHTGLCFYLSFKPFYKKALANLAEIEECTS